MKKEITVKTSAVYDARALAQLVGKANEFTSKIMMDMDSQCVNVKSIMQGLCEAGGQLSS